MFFFFNDTATTEIYTLSLHDALPICLAGVVGLLDEGGAGLAGEAALHRADEAGGGGGLARGGGERESTRLESKHPQKFYGRFFFEKKKKINNGMISPRTKQEPYYNHA